MNIKLVSDGTSGGTYLADLEGNRIENVELDEVQFHPVDCLHANINTAPVTLTFSFIPVELTIDRKPFSVKYIKEESVSYSRNCNPPMPPEPEPLMDQDPMPPAPKSQDCGCDSVTPKSVVRKLADFFDQLAK